MACRMGVASIALVIACGPTVADDTVGGSASDGGTSSGSASASASASGTATGTTDPTGTATVMSSSGPLDTGSSADDSCPPDEGDDDSPVFDVGPPSPACDLFAQDCPMGEKCVPFGFDTRYCVPIEPEPIPDGDPCERGMLDDPCGAGSWCGLIDFDTSVGTCIPMCTGSPADPMCPEEMICVIDDEDIVAYCAPPCDPFDPDACGRHACLPTAHGFGCVPSGGHTRGEGCIDDDSCAAALVCAPGDTVPGCCDARCCAPLCSDAHPCKPGTCVPLDPPVPGPDGIGRCAQ